jgi:RND family efflux transporter MFP subunit
MSDQLSSDLASLQIDRETSPDRKGPARYAIIGGAVIGVAAAGYFVAVPYLSSRIFKTEVSVTEIALVSPAHAAIELTSSGYVMPQTVSQVSAKVGGKVAKVFVNQGDVVAEGDVLLEMELFDQQAAVAAARSRVAAARAAVQTSRAQLAEAKQLAARAEELFSKGVGPKAAAEDAAARVESVQAAVKASEAQVKAAQAEVTALEINLTNYTLRAPISGTIISKPPEIGEIVGPTMPGIGAQVGGIELADFTTLAVETDVPEGRLHLVTLGGPAEITLDAFPNERYRGKVLEIVPRVNRAKATVMVKVAFVDDFKGVLPDMAARVSFLNSEIDAAAIKEPPKLIVPGSAIAERDGAKVVFEIEGGAVRMMPVELGEPYGSGFVLLAGPAAGSKVVKNPSGDLSDGQKIKERTDG